MWTFFVFHSALEPSPSSLPFSIFLLFLRPIVFLPFSSSLYLKIFYVNIAWIMQLWNDSDTWSTVIRNSLFVNVDTPAVTEPKQTNSQACACKHAHHTRIHTRTLDWCSVYSYVSSQIWSPQEFNGVQSPVLCTVWRVAQWGVQNISWQCVH